MPGGGGSPARRVARAAALLLAVSAAAAGRDARAFVDPLEHRAVQSGLAPRRLLTAVASTGSSLVAVGQRGHVIVSRDRGATWQQASVPVSTDLTAVWFVSPLRGWAVGHDGVVLVSDDGGATWAKQLDRGDVQRLLAAWRPEVRALAVPGLPEQLEILGTSDADPAFLDVWFADERTGFAVGVFNLVLRTADGGRTWTPWLDRTANPEGLHLHAIRRVAGRVFVAGERGLLLRLDPSGGRFERTTLGHGGTLFGITGNDAVAIAFGLRGSAFRSRDGGDAWERLQTGTEEALATAAAWPDGALALVTRSGQAIVTEDGGATFRAAAHARPGMTSGAVALDERTLALVGVQGVRLREVPRR